MPKLWQINGRTARVSGPHSAWLSTNLPPGCFWTSNWSREEVGEDSKVVVAHQNQEMVIWLNLQIIALPLPVLADANGGKMGGKIPEKKIIKWQDCGLLCNCPQPIHTVSGCWGEHESDCSGGLLLSVPHRIMKPKNNGVYKNSKRISGLALCLLVTKLSRTGNLIVFPFY